MAQTKHMLIARSETYRLDKLASLLRKMQQLNEELEIVKSELEYLRKENATLKVTASKGTDLQSAM